uniref:DUF4283 domain-containing protein n=1 Tax=Tanacetum cinerariifolium TaxID=118510 RepID=A0A6L2J5W6_TANCI|nr:hypothetical protein [Tanacetum cinerariifolium]GFA49150.1 hypothetical protein [Tanacetum cinerariifolium]
MKPKPNEPKENPSFASAVNCFVALNGKSPIDKGIRITLQEHDLIQVENTTEVLLVKVKEVDTMRSIYHVCRNEGFDNLKIHHVSRLWIWIKFPNANALCAWGLAAYKKVASTMGKFKFFEDDTSTSMSTRRVCISTNKQNFISEEIHVTINGNIFKVQVQELATWSINIEDDQSYVASDEETKEEE